MQTPVAGNTDFCKEVRIYVRQYSEITGIHGFRYFNEKRSRGEKLLWFAILLTCLFGCIFMIYKIIKKYECSPVVVSFTSADTPIYEIPFPSITICPEAKYSSSKFNYTDIYFKLNRSEEATIEKTELRHYGYVNLLCNGNEPCWNNGNKTIDEDFFEIIEQLAPDIEIDCWEGETSYDFQKTFTPIIIDQGICYSFNILDREEIFRDHVAHYGNFHRVSNRLVNFDIEWGYNKDTLDTYPKRALQSGADNSLDIYLKYNSNDTDYICNNFLQGFRILIHSPWDAPHLSSYYFRIPLDKAVVAAVDPELIITSEAVRKLDPQKRKCYLTSERSLQHFKTYSQSHCMLECLTNYTLHKCGCVQFYMPRNKSTPICGQGSYKCLSDARRKSKIKEIESKMYDYSECDCKPQCTDLQYHVETSHSHFYWRDYFKIQKRHGIDEPNMYRDEIHWSVLSVYLKKEQFKTLERNELYGVADLISNFGGLLGLFTGFSIISLAEIIYFLSIRILCNRRLYGHWFGDMKHKV